MTTSALLVIQHEDACPPAWFGDWLGDAGLWLDVLRAHRGAPIPTDLAGYAGLMVLGGEMGAGDDATHAWLTATKALIRHVVAKEQPFLGICLGHQLAAVALGGEVVANPNGPATGITPIALTRAGREDELLGLLGPDAVAVQWNDDVVARLPVGTVELARSPDGSVQAARFGENAWGVQFHPELSPEVFRLWTGDKPSAEHLRADGVDIAGVSAMVDASEQQLRAVWEPFARRFAEISAAHGTH